MNYLIPSACKENTYRSPIGIEGQIQAAGLSRSEISRWSFSMLRMLSIVSMCLWSLFGLLHAQDVSEQRSVNLADLAESRDWKRVQNSIERDSTKVRDRQPDGMTALHWAVLQEDAEMVRRLLEAGADVDATTQYGVSPLEIACQRGDAETVGQLLTAKPRLDSPGVRSPLMTAARQGSLQVVDRLLNAGASAEVTDESGQTALMWAAAAGHSAVVDRLIRNGADLHRSLPSGFNAYFFAARQGHTDVVETLLKAGIDVQSTMSVKTKGGRNALPNSSALILAVENGHYELALKLVEWGADPNDQRTGHAPLHILSWVRKPKRSDGFDGDPPPRGSGTISSLEFAKQLVRLGANVNLQIANGRSPGKAQLNSQGATPFLYACKTADLPLMKALVELGANIHLSNADGCTAFLAVAGVGTVAVDEEPGSETEVLEALEYLLALGVELNVHTKQGETAMHGAAYRAYPKVISFLHQRGASSSLWNQKNEHGWSPFDIADGKRPGSVKPNPDVRRALIDALAPSKQE